MGVVKFYLQLPLPFKKKCSLNPTEQVKFEFRFVNYLQKIYNLETLRESQLLSSVR